jgi:hypothetical protein
MRSSRPRLDRSIVICARSAKRSGPYAHTTQITVVSLWLLMFFCRFHLSMTFAWYLNTQ